jgi:RAB protein geranylgeranyltransferase component A
VKNSLKKKEIQDRTGETAHSLGTFAALVEDVDSVPGILMSFYNSKSWGLDALFCLCRHCTRMVNILIQSQTLTYMEFKGKKIM